MVEAVEEGNRIVDLGLVGARAGNLVAREDRHCENEIVSCVGGGVLRRLMCDEKEEEI